MLSLAFWLELRKSKGNQCVCAAMSHVDAEVTFDSIDSGTAGEDVGDALMTALDASLCLAVVLVLVLVWRITLL
jgi:hypothetical protein